MYLREVNKVIIIIIIIHIYQLGTGRHTQKAEPVGGVYL